MPIQFTELFTWLLHKIAMKAVYINMINSNNNFLKLIFILNLLAYAL